MTQAAAFPYITGWRQVMAGVLNPATLKWMLCTSNVVPDPRDDVLDGTVFGGGVDYTAAEIVATNYSGGYGGTLRKTITGFSFDDNDADLSIDCACSSPPSWSTLGGATNATIAYAILVAESGGVDSSSIPVFCYPILPSYVTSGLTYVAPISTFHRMLVRPDLVVTR